MRKKDMPNWAEIPISRELIAKPLQSQERNSLVKVLSRQNKQNCLLSPPTYVHIWCSSFNKWRSIPILTDLKMCSII